MPHWFLEGLLDMLWPPRTTCLICEHRLREAATIPVCPDCWRLLPAPTARPCCANCARPLRGDGPLCVDCTAGTAFGRVYALGLHDGPLREAIHHLKFGGRSVLGIPLGNLLGEAIAQRHPVWGLPCVHANPEPVVVPVPLHPVRERDRGYNQATLIAKGVASRLSAPLLERALRRTRVTPHQAKLDRLGRLRNLEGAIALAAGTSPHTPWHGKAVLLVDDVLTTGATASAVAQVLLASGARRVDLAVLAVSSTPIKGGAKIPLNETQNRFDI